MQDHSQGFSMQDAQRLAQSEDGQRLLELLQRSDPQRLQQAMAQAASGDYDEMKKTMTALLASPEAKALLKRLGG